MLVSFVVASKRLIVLLNNLKKRKTTIPQSWLSIERPYGPEALMNTHEYVRKHHWGYQADENLSTEALVKEEYIEFDLP